MGQEWLVKPQNEDAVKMGRKTGAGQWGEEDLGLLNEYSNWQITDAWINTWKGAWKDSGKMAGSLDG